MACKSVAKQQKPNTPYKQYKQYKQQKYFPRTLEEQWWCPIATFSNSDADGPWSICLSHSGWHSGRAERRTSSARRANPCLEEREREQEKGRLATILHQYICTTSVQRLRSVLRFSVKLTHQELEGKSNGKMARDTGEQTCARENQHQTDRFDQYLNQYKQLYLTWVHNKEQ